jgi:hypothetical protein
LNAIRKNEDAILRAMALFPYMLGKQVTKLLYSEGSHRSVLEIMKKLFDEGYVERKPLPSQIQKGSVPYVYFLSAPGRHYLESLGYDFSTWRYPSEMKLVHSSHLWHCLEVNDFLIAGITTAHSNPDVQLIETRHDLVLKSLDLPVKPDGWQLFHLKGIEEAAVWLELDRGTEKIKVWKTKIQTILGYIHGNYAHDFGTPTITVAIVVPASVQQREHRIGELRSWTEQVLTATQQEYEHDVFRFIALPEEIQSETLYLSPCWKRPFSKGKYRLLEI